MESKIESRNRIFSHLVFPILIFFPKINIVSIPGYWQGIRIEDILLFFYLINLFTSKVVLINLSQRYFFFSGLFLLLYIFFSNLISLLNGNDLRLAMMIRLFEYIILVFFVKNLNLDKKLITKFFYFYIILNFIITILQVNKIIGSISSRGYLDPSHSLNDRTFGIAGGSWELGILLTLSFFIILKNTNNIVRDYLIFVPIIYLQIFFSYSKTSIIAFGIIVLIMLPNIIRNIHHGYQRIQFGYGILLSLIIFVFIFNNENLVFSNYIKLITNFNFYSFKETMYDFIFYVKIPEISEVDKSLLSLWHRLMTWKDIINIYISNDINILFGTGFVKYLYLESTYLRVLTSFGVIGAIIVMVIITKLNLYHLIYLLMISFSFDFFISFKIFLFFLILCNNFLNSSSITLTK